MKRVLEDLEGIIIQKIRKQRILHFRNQLNIVHIRP